MPEINQFGSGTPGDAQSCARCETLLMDVLDHTASSEDQAFFDRHLASCVGCSRMFMDAKRGAAWLEMLRDPRPEPPATLYERILTHTSGIGSPAALAPAPSYGADTPGPLVPLPVPAYLQSNVIPFRPHGVAYTFGQRMLQPRLAMTAAMAFFSIALTLNLTGVHVTELRAGDLRPSNLRRGFHEANAHVVRYYDNLRVVYELEARVHEIQRTTEPEPETSAPASTAPSNPDKPDGGTPKAGPKPGPGSSLREPLFPNPRSVASLTLREIYPQPHTRSKGDRS